MGVGGDGDRIGGVRVDCPFEILIYRWCGGFEMVRGFSEIDGVFEAAI